MIVEALVRFCCGVLVGLFETCEYVNVPTEALDPFYNIIQYGNYIVGIDVLAVFAGSVVAWWTMHLSIGVALWVYEKIPFV